LTRWSSPKLAAYAVLSATGLLASLVTGRPELVALTAPFVLTLGLGLALAVPPRVRVSLSLDQERAVEGDEVQARLVLESETPVDRLDVYVRLPGGIAVAGEPNRMSISMRAGERREVELPLDAYRYGGHVLGPTYLRAHDPLGLLAWEGADGTRPQLRVYPRAEVLRRVLRPRETQVFAGNETSYRKGEGIEFADLRQFAPGDPLKRVNWRASARRGGELWVNESHPERNTDVILFVDSFAEARLGGEGTLDLAVRATAALADAYARRRDRVGLIGYGGVLRWLVPGSGTVQLYRIVDALLDTEIVLSYYWKEIDLIPRRVLPAKALVIALSPLLDQRSVGALLDLRARGFDLAVIEISPIPYAPRPGAGLPALAYDVWALQRDALRHRLRSAGIAVTEWQSDSSLQQHLEEVREFRRHGRLVRA
jgi:uncharacterized protein (DUF58 family)